MKPFFYIAAPYIHADARVIEERIFQVGDFCSSLVRNEVHFFSPLTHGHEIDQHCATGDRSCYWCELDLRYLPFCTAMIVLQLEGWNKSYGVRNERRAAELLLLPIYYVEPKPDPYHYDDVVRAIQDQAVSVLCEKARSYGPGSSSELWAQFQSILDHTSCGGSKRG